MAKNNSELISDIKELSKQFDVDYEEMLKIFINNLKEIPKDVDRSSKKETFLKMIKKHISIFYYPKNDKKSFLTMYMNFGKEHEKVISIMKCDASLLFREGGDNFANQIVLANIKSISTYLSYLIEFIHDQFQLLSSYSNLEPDSSLCILDKKAKNALKDGSISLKNEKYKVVLKGLGNVGFISFPIKQLSFKIVFDLGNKIVTYTLTKNQTNKLISKEVDKKKGQECKELIKWVDTNKLNNNRTQYCLVPSQFSFSRVGLFETSLVKRYKKEYEKESDLCSELEAYIIKKKIKIININMKFGLVVNMNINTENDISGSDFDEFGDDEVVISEVEKQNNICKLHDDFAKKFEYLIQENYIDMISIQKTNIQIKDQKINSYEKITTNTSQNQQSPLITNPKNDDDDESDKSDDESLDDVEISDNTSET